MECDEAAAGIIARLNALADDEGNPPALLVPVDMDKKKPSVRHKGGAWNLQRCAEWFKRKHKPCRLGLLLRNIIVLDFDNMEAYEGKKSIATLFAKELAEAPMARTRRGVHIYLKLSPDAESRGITDGPLVDPQTGNKLCTDLKTITARVEDGHRTASLVLIPPSAFVPASDGFYEWVPGRSLMDVAPHVPSIELIQALAKCLVKNVKAFKKGLKPAKPVGKPRGKGKGAKVSGGGGGGGGDDNGGDNGGNTQDNDDPEEKLEWTVAGGVAARRPDGTLCPKPNRERDVADVEAMVRRKGSRGDFNWSSEWTRGCASGISFAYDGACFLCGKEEGHDNSYKFYWSKSGIRRVSAHSVQYGSCTSAPEGVALPFSPASLRLYGDRFVAALDATARRLSPAALAAVNSLSLGVRMLTDKAGGPMDAAWYDAETGTVYAAIDRRTWCVVTADSAQIGCRDGILGGLNAECLVRQTEAPWSRSKSDYSEERLCIRSCNKLRRALAEA